MGEIHVVLQALVKVLAARLEAEARLERAEATLPINTEPTNTAELSLRSLQAAPMEAK
jgi:hypothetical protein